MTQEEGKLDSKTLTDTLTPYSFGESSNSQPYNIVAIPVFKNILWQ